MSVSQDLILYHTEWKCVCAHLESCCQDSLYYFAFERCLLQTGHLAMETLLSLTSKRAGDWFKEELRLLGGLDHIVDKGRCMRCSDR